jgi:hypothetical protein
MTSWSSFRRSPRIARLPLPGNRTNRCQVLAWQASRIRPALRLRVAADVSASSVMTNCVVRSRESTQRSC